VRHVGESLHARLQRVSEFLFEEEDEHGAEKHIKAFRITFASGFEIVALSSRPRSLRGRQGYVILDEVRLPRGRRRPAEGAMALLIWGGKSAGDLDHNGVDNEFNTLLTEIRSGKRPGQWCAARSTTPSGPASTCGSACGAASTGRPRRGGLARGDLQVLRRRRGGELECIPSQGSGVYLTRALIEACCSTEIPRPRLHCPAGFELKPEPERRSYVDAWLEQTVQPEIDKLDRNLSHAAGQDFAARAMSPAW